VISSRFPTGYISSRGSEGKNKEDPPSLVVTLGEGAYTTKAPPPRGDYGSSVFELLCFPSLLTNPGRNVRNSSHLNSLALPVSRGANALRILILDRNFPVRVKVRIDINCQFPPRLSHSRSDAGTDTCKKTRTCSASPTCECLVHARNCFTRHVGLPGHWCCWTVVSQFRSQRTVSRREEQTRTLWVGPWRPFIHQYLCCRRSS